MNYPPIFETCAADAGVVALLGESGGALRLYPAGSAPQGAAKPYAVWQFIGGGPENYLGGRPDIDRFALQVDAYADTLSAARAIADAIEEAIEMLAHVTAFRGEEKDPETALYRVGFDLEWFVARPAPGPTPVSSEPTPVSSSGGGLAAYPLDDDGTVAAALGYGLAATNAPAYLRADYTYVDMGSTVVAAPATPNALGLQAVTVAPGTILACEAVVHVAATDHTEIGIACFDSVSGTLAGGIWTCSIANDDGNTPTYTVDVEGTSAARTSPAAGFRIGLSINGNTGQVTGHTTDGDIASLAAFTPGRRVTFVLFIDDGGGAPGALGQACSIELVPAAADMALTYPVGAVDVFGDVI